MLIFNTNLPVYHGCKYILYLQAEVAAFQIIYQIFLPKVKFSNKSHDDSRH